MPGMVFISATQFRPFMGSSAIWVRSTRNAFSMVLLVTKVRFRFNGQNLCHRANSEPDLSDVQLGVDIQGDRDLGLLEACLLDSMTYLPGWILMAWKRPA